MNITKDEARILSELLTDGKYDLSRLATKHNGIETIGALTELEKRLHSVGKDLRRNGRKSHNSFTDCMNRFVNRYKSEQDVTPPKKVKTFKLTKKGKIDAIQLSTASSEDRKTVLLVEDTEGNFFKLGKDAKFHPLPKIKRNPKHK